MPTVGDITRKLNALYDDLSCNVTRIYGRQDLHMAIDLVYHSPIRFKFDGRMLEKGYPEILVVGDTRVGKSVCAETLMKHYGLGVSAQAESMSYAGLVGGLQKTNGERWDITWGKLPQNNRRLVIIDEASGMEKEIIGKLSSIRSSGIATIEKIQSQRTEAKTRMLWLSNPRGRETVNHFSSGVHVIESLCDQPEDIARWDLALVVGKGDVNISEIRSKHKAKVEHVHTAELCRTLILWAWTREAHEVILSPEAEDACYTYGELIAKKYSSDFTLVIDAEQPVKMARLATSLAARVFSTDDGVRLLVGPEHVEYIYQYMQQVYDAPSFGYNTWSSNRNEGQAIIDAEAIEKFMQRIGKMGCYKFLELDKVKLKDVEEYLGVSTEEARSILSSLLMNNALRRFYGDFYRKSPDFNKMLRQFALTYTGRAKPKDDI